MVRLVGLLLLLFPRAFRERYGAELLDTFAERWREERSRAGQMEFLIRTFSNLVLSAVRARVDGMRGASEPAAVAVATRQSPRRRSSGDGFMWRFAEDIRYALRFLGRNPAFTLIVLLTLGLGIGMNTAVYSVLYGALYAPLPYGDADELVWVGRTHPSLGNTLLPLSPANYEDVRNSLTLLRSLEAETGRSYVLTDGDEAARYAGGRVTHGFFDMLGVVPAVGRSFTAADDEPGAPAVVIVSDGFWKTQLGADRNVIGQTLRLNDEAHTVIGILPESFAFFNRALWVPMRFTEQARATRGSNYLRMFGRLRPGADATRAAAELEALWTPLREAFPEGNEDTNLTALPLRDALTQARRTPLFIVAGAAAFVLLIACANVANLMLVRAERRQREVGVRAALGAGRGRLVTQFLTEGVLTSALGGALGVLIAWAGVRALIGVFGEAVPRSTIVGINGPVLGFTLLAAVVTGILVGLAPAWRAGVDFSVLREGNRGGTVGFTRLGRALVVAEVALAIVLVTGAGLLLKSYARATDSDLGFEREGLIAANYWFPSARYSSGDELQRFMDQLIARLESNADISSITTASMVPIREFGNNYTEVGVEGRDAKSSFVESRVVAPSYFDAIGIDIQAGRNFTDAEARDGATVAIINRTLARQLFGDDDPIGWQLAGVGTPTEIIGVVEDSRDPGPDQAPRPMIYGPTQSATNLLVRSTREPGAVAALLRSAAAAIDPDVRLLRIEPMSEILDRALAGRRFQLTLLATFALTALVLACVGIYGVLSYAVERQTREIGVRMALGARAAGVATRIAWRGGQLAVLGVVIGAAGAFALRQTIASQLFDVESFDPVVYLGVSAILLMTAAVACLIPARRAAIIDPVRALHTE